jgi:IS1 transposase
VVDPTKPYLICPTCGSDDIVKIPKEKGRLTIQMDELWSLIPVKRQAALGKENGKTSYIERLNNTLRQRISRLVRKSLSFSKKIGNHIGAIRFYPRL